MLKYVVIDLAHLDREQVEQLLTEAYNQGYSDGVNSVTTQDYGTFLSPSLANNNIHLTASNSTSSKTPR